VSPRAGSLRCEVAVSRAVGGPCSVCSTAHGRAAGSSRRRWGRGCQHAESGYPCGARVRSGCSVARPKARGSRSPAPGDRTPGTESGVRGGLAGKENLGDPPQGVAGNLDVGLDGISGRSRAAVVALVRSSEWVRVRRWSDSGRAWWERGSVLREQGVWWRAAKKFRQGRSGWQRISGRGVMRAREKLGKVWREWSRQTIAAVSTVSIGILGDLEDGATEKLGGGERGSTG
jgi:hypothetical protein